MNKIINFKDIKGKKIRKKHLIYFLFLVILMYIIYSIYLIIKKPNDTVIVNSGVLTLEESANGYIIRNETVLEGNNYKNEITSIVSEGERAAKGQTIFRYNSSNEEEVKAKIEEVNLKLQEALSNELKLFNTTDIKNLESQIDEKVQDLNKLTDIHTISEYKKEIEKNTNKKAKITGESSKSGSYIKSLTEQKEKYEKELTEGSEYIKTPVSGIVSYRVDGLESILTTTDFSNLTEETLENLEIKTGKIISSSTEKRKSYR